MRRGGTSDNAALDRQGDVGQTALLFLAFKVCEDGVHVIRELLTETRQRNYALPRLLSGTAIEKATLPFANLL